MFNIKYISSFILLVILFRVPIHAMELQKNKKEKPEYSFWDRLWNGNAKIITIAKNTPLLRDSEWKNIVIYEKKLDKNDLDINKVECSVFEYNNYDKILYKNETNHVMYNFREKYTDVKTQIKDNNDSQSIQIKHSLNFNGLKEINEPPKIFYPQGLSKDIQIVCKGGFTLERGTALLAVCIALAYKVNKSLD